MTRTRVKSRGRRATRHGESQSVSDFWWARVRGRPHRFISQLCVRNSPPPTNSEFSEFAAATQQTFPQRAKRSSETQLAAKFAWKISGNFQEENKKKHCNRFSVSKSKQRRKTSEKTLEIASNLGGTLKIGPENVVTNVEKRNFFLFLIKKKQFCVSSNKSNGKVGQTLASSCVTRRKAYQPAVSGQQFFCCGFVEICGQQERKISWILIATIFAIEVANCAQNKKIRLRKSGEFADLWAENSFLLFFLECFWWKVFLGKTE